MTTDAHSPAEMAALAFSVLPVRSAQAVNQRLTVAERMRLRESLSRITGATDEQRASAMRALAQQVQGGLEWPRPPMHDDKDCPFTVVGSHPRYCVVDVLDRVAERDALEVVVTLCHLEAGLRSEIWGRVSARTRGLVAPRLQEVHLVSQSKTKDYARDINTRLTRSLRFTGKRAG